MAVAPKKEFIDVRPDLFEYTDAKDFLKDWMKFLKSQGLSMRNLARQAQLASGYLPMVLKGDRVLSNKILKLLAPHLRLEQRELKYLTYLLSLERAQSQSEKVRIFEKLKAFKSFKLRHRKNLATQKLLTRWYHAAIYEMSYLRGFTDDPEAIQSQLAFHVSIRDIKSAILFLETEGFLTRDAHGRLRVSERELVCDEGIYRLAMSEFHRQMLGLATESIFAIDRELRQLLTHTMAIEISKIEEAKLILYQALNQIKNLGDTSQSHDEVYQFSLLMFPLSRPGRPHAP